MNDLNSSQSDELENRISPSNIGRLGNDDETSKEDVINLEEKSEVEEDAIKHAPIDEAKVDSSELDSEKIYKSEYSAEYLLNMDIKEIPCLIDPIMPQVGVIALAGSSDTGKSHLLRQLSLAIVSGENEFLGWKINARYKSVIYISTEDDFTAY